MDEMDLIRTTLRPPEPPAEAVEAGRRRLDQFVRGTNGQLVRSRPRWLVPGLGLTAAVAAATAVVVLAGGTQPARSGVTAPPSRVSPASPVSPVSAQDVLNTAAAAAQRTPANSSGTYWYLKITMDPENGQGPIVDEHWSTRDGRTWFRARNGELLEQPADAGMLGPFFLAGQELTFTRLQDLPTDPAALAQWIVNSVAEHGGKSGGPQTDPDFQRQFQLDSYVQLISELPVPPGVRAAAFQALGRLPGVTNMGPMRGGQGLSIATINGHVVTLIIDPKTGRLLYTSFLVKPDSSEWFQGAATATITGQWTNTLG